MNFLVIKKLECTDCGEFFDTLDVQKIFNEKYIKCKDCWAKFYGDIEENIRNYDGELFGFEKNYAKSFSY